MMKRPFKKIRTAIDITKKTGVMAPITVLLLLSACVAGPAERIILPQNQEPEAEQTGIYVVVDWQTRTTGQDIPEWVRRFLNGGNREVETMPQYRDRYVFVVEGRGSSLEPLWYWAEEFSTQQDFPRLAAVRVEERLAGAAVLYPDDEYGEFFETMVKRASDAAYDGVRREDSYWLLRRFYTEDRDTDREFYDFFILVSVDREVLAARIGGLLDDPRGIRPPTRDQAAAIGRIRENFFDGF